MTHQEKADTIVRALAFYSSGQNDNGVERRAALRALEELLKELRDAQEALVDSLSTVDEMLAEKGES